MTCPPHLRSDGAPHTHTHMLTLCLLPPPEKVHFQHTAKLIRQLVGQRANYTLQVGRRLPCAPPPISHLSLCALRSTQTRATSSAATPLGAIWPAPWSTSSRSASGCRTPPCRWFRRKKGKKRVSQARPARPRRYPTPTFVVLLFLWRRGPHAPRDPPSFLRNWTEKTVCPVASLVLTLCIIVTWFPSPCLTSWERFSAVDFGPAQSPLPDPFFLGPSHVSASAAASPSPVSRRPDVDVSYPCRSVFSVR